MRRLSPAVLGRELDVQRGRDRRSVRVPSPDFEPGVDDRRTLARKARVAYTHGKAARWPYAFRDDDHDWGDAIPCPSY